MLEAFFIARSFLLSYDFTMKTLITTLGLMLSTSLFSSSATAMDVCQFKAWNHLDFRLQTGQFRDGTCYISVGSGKLNDLIYRSYLITSKGQLMIFNSFGDGPSSTHTGARVYYFYPKQSALDLRLDQDDVVVTMVSGHELIFDASQVELAAMSEAKVVVDSEIRPDNEGGVEIELDRSYLLDMGFKLGNTPEWDLSRPSVFRNSRGQACRFKNRELFYKKDDEVYPRYSDDRKLQSVISSKCPHFIFD